MDNLFIFLLIITSKLISLFSIFSSSLINTSNSKSSNKNSHRCLLTTSQRKVICFYPSFLLTHVKLPSLYPPLTHHSPLKKEASLYQHQSAEMSNLLNTTNEFMSLSNRLTQCYVGCILQGVASFQ